MNEPRASFWSWSVQFLRALARQLAAAVYIVVAIAFLSSHTLGHPWITDVLDPGMTLVGGYVVGALIAGPWWSTGLVGLFVALIRVGLTLGMGASLSSLSAVALGKWAALTTIVGALGATLAVWRRRRNRP